MQTISTTYIKTAFLRPFAAFLILICAAIGASIPASAETVSQKEAKKKAQLFFNQAYKETVAPVKLVYNGKRLTTGRFFSPSTSTISSAEASSSSRLKTRLFQFLAIASRERSTLTGSAMAKKAG